MVEGRAAKSYKNFVDTFLLYQAIFENSGDLLSILELPYPLYVDVILKQIEEKKREKQLLKQKLRQSELSQLAKKPRGR